VYTVYRATSCERRDSACCQPLLGANGGRHLYHGVIVQLAAGLERRRRKFSEAINAPFEEVEMTGRPGVRAVLIFK